MSKDQYIKPYRKGKHLTYEDRLKLEYYYMKNLKLPKKKKWTVIQIIEKLGISRSTYYYELKKGTYYSQNHDEPLYSADQAQDNTDYNVSARGPELKIEKSYEIAEFIESKIADEDYSPEAVVYFMKQTPDNFSFIPCARTIYNYINDEVFGRLTVKELPRKGEKTKRKYRKRRLSQRDPESKSITERPAVVDSRTEVGHWEMDCLESGKGKGNEALLVLVERVTRYVRLMRLHSVSQSEVLRHIDGLETEVSTDHFKNTFKTVTVDNGSEFLDWRSLEKSALKSNNHRTEVYYCHPYASYERGSVENANGLLRRKIPKGSAIQLLTDERIQEIEDWINNYPRGIIEGKSAIQMVAQYDEMTCLHQRP